MSKLMCFDRNLGFQYLKKLSDVGMFDYEIAIVSDILKVCGPIKKKGREMGALLE